MIMNLFRRGTSDDTDNVVKDQDRLKSQKDYKLSKFVRLMIYSYLDNRTFLDKISVLSFSERNAIKNSEISGVGRTWKLDATVFEKWAKEGKSVE